MTDKHKETGKAGGLVGDRSNIELLAELYKILIVQQIWLEGCNG